MIAQKLEIVMDVSYSGLKSKLETGLKGVYDTVGKLQSMKIDTNNLIKNMTAPNWSLFISKLFSPASLIAFFAAMGAFGITSAITQQVAGVQATGGLGLGTGTAPGTTTETGTQFAETAQSILGTTGTAAGGINDVTTALESFFQITGNLTDATTVVQNLMEALSVPGVGANISTILGPLVQFLQTTKTTDVSGIDEVIANILQSAQLAGPSGGGIAGILSGIQGLAQAAAIANTPFSTLNQLILAFGSEIGAPGGGLQNAQVQLQEVTQVLSGTNTQFSTLTEMPATFSANLQSQGVVGAIAGLDKKIQGLSGHQADFIAGILGFPANVVIATNAFAPLETAIQNGINLTATSGTQASAIIKKNFDDTRTALDLLNQEQEKLISTWDKSIFGETFSAGLSAFAATLKGISGVLGDINKLLSFTPSQIAGSVGSFIEGLAGNIGNLPTTLPSAVSQMQSGLGGTGKGINTVDWGGLMSQLSNTSLSGILGAILLNGSLSPASSTPIKGQAPVSSSALSSGTVNIQNTFNVPTVGMTPNSVKSVQKANYYNLNYK